MSSVLRQAAKQVLKRLGLYSVMTMAVTSGNRLVRSAQLARASDTQQVTVGEAQAQFWMTSLNEFGELRKLPERPIIEDLIGRLRPDDVFYDIGANIGVYACLAASVLDTEVVAFDPEPDNARRMEENIELNDADVRLYQYALSNSRGTAEFAVRLFDGRSQTGPASHSLVTDTVAEGEIISVETVVGDEFVSDEGLPLPTVVKIDVEGGEWQVLMGLEETLSNSSCRIVYCELHEEPLRSQGQSPESVIELLESMGYEVEVPFERSGNPFVRAVRPE